MKTLILSLLLCVNCVTAQEKMRSFEELYTYLDKKYLGNDQDLLLGLQAGLHEMCDYRNIQTALVKEQLAPLAQKGGRTVSEMFIDSMFSGIKTVLLPKKFSNEFRQLGKKMAVLTELHCACASKAKGKTALDKLKRIEGCAERNAQTEDALVAILKETAIADMDRVQNASEAYTFIHCPVFSTLLKEHIYSYLPDDDDASDVESLMLEKIRAARGYWQRKSMDSLSNIFPDYQQYTGQLNGVFEARPATVKSDFEIKKINGLPALEYIYYTGRGNDLSIINRVTYTFSGNSASAVISSAEVLSLEQIPGGQKLQQKMRDDTRGTTPSFPTRLPPPPAPKRKN